MKEEQHIQHIFQTVRELPPEVELAGIEQFVLAQPVTVFQPPAGGDGGSSGLLTIKNTIVMISSISIIGSVALFFGGGNDKPSAATAPGSDTPTRQTLVLDSAPVLLENAVPKSIPAQDDVVLAKPGNPYFTPNLDTANPPNETHYGVGVSAQYPVAPTATPATVAAAKDPGECDDEKHVLSSFAKEMYTDGLIDSQRFTFTFTENALTVNGRRQPAAMYKKYGAIFERLTETKIGRGTHMHAFVAPGRCSTSLSLNDKKTETGRKNETLEEQNPLGKAQVRVLPPFSVVELQCNANLELVAGDKYEAEIVGDEDEAARYEMEVREDRLVIVAKPGVNRVRKNCASITLTVPADKLSRVSLGSSGNIDFRSEFENVSVLEIQGSGSIIVGPGLKSSDLHVFVIGSGTVDLMALRASKASVHIPGSGTVLIAGGGDAVTVDISGSGNADLGQFNTQTADCDISGSGSIFLRVDQKLNAEISGSGVITYYGSPVITQHITGSGVIIKQ